VYLLLYKSLINLIFRFGGIYSDTDSLLVNPLDVENENFIGTEWCENDELEWCFEYPKFLFNVTSQNPSTFTMSIGVMKFQPAHPLLKHALEKFSTESYDPNRWGCGTVLMSEAYKDLIENGTELSLQVFDPFEFYPIGYQSIGNYFHLYDESLWEDIQRESKALHLFGKMTSKTTISNGSLVDRAIKRIEPKHKNTK